MPGFLAFLPGCAKEKSAVLIFLCKNANCKVNGIISCWLASLKSLHADNAFYFSIPWVYNAVAWEKLFPREEKRGIGELEKRGVEKTLHSTQIGH
mgnify:CR=1 FL=1